MSSITFKSHAKVNIGLQVLNKRPDGYHNLNTIFQELEFHDVVTLEKIERGCELTSNDKNFPLDSTNTCAKAYTAILGQFPDFGGIKVHVEKMIPQGAGLGGGSSNGATVLKGINNLYGLGLSSKDLQGFGVRIGADVPFFIEGGTQLGEGIGEKLSPINIKLDSTVLLVIPTTFISTEWAYKELKNALEGRVDKANFADLFRSDIIPFELFKNDFERIVIPAHPKIGKIKDALIENGAQFASLSGSGSTVFGMFDEDTAAKAAEFILSSDYRTILTHPIHN
jgi:4-diphosphocytidyl-2-C-methyl-D-erythritol kinase